MFMFLELDLIPEKSRIWNFVSLMLKLRGLVSSCGILFGANFFFEQNIFYRVLTIFVIPVYKV